MQLRILASTAVAAAFVTGAAASAQTISASDVSGASVTSSTTVAGLFAPGGPPGGTASVPAPPSLTVPAGAQSLFTQQGAQQLGNTLSALAGGGGAPSGFTSALNSLTGALSQIQPGGSGAPINVGALANALQSFNAMVNNAPGSVLSNQQAAGQLQQLRAALIQFANAVVGG